MRWASTSEFRRRRRDPDAEGKWIEQAINLKVDGLIINNCKPEGPEGVAHKAIDSGINVVACGLDSCAKVRQRG
jgi:ABC-type sugar transport system substrate-binding protein